MDIRLGGEVYEEISWTAFTAAYDLYVQQVLTDAGLTDLLIKQESLPSEQRQGSGKLFLQQLAYSGKLHDFFVAFIQPKDGKWSAPWAVETARKLDKLTAEPEKKLILTLLIKGVNDFFQRGRRSSKIFR